MAATPNTEPALIQPVGLPPPPPEPPQPQQTAKADELTTPARSTKPDSTDKAETATKPEAQGNAGTAETDPVRQLLDRMEKLSPMIGSADPALARTLQNLSLRGADPDQRSQPGFRHEVAYALQDVEKSPIGRLEIPAATRAEMTKLAESAVGLTNDRALGLMAATAAIQDRALVADIRNMGRELGRRVDQSTPEIDSRIDTLENRARLGSRPTETADRATAPDARASQAGERSAAGSAPPRDDVDVERTRAPIQSNDARANGNAPGGASPNGHNQSQGTLQHSVLDTLLRAMRPEPNQPQPPWEPPATPVGDRLAASERRAQVNSDDRTLASAERRGQAALEALQGFSNGEGATVMGKIQAAAKTEPGGMAQVLSEMRDGGRFADLRKQFGNALADDTGFAAAYDKAAGALAAYGKTRTEIEPILARRPDASAFTQRLTEMDAEIGKAASATPSKTEGRSMMEDLAKQAADLLHRAVDSVKAAFSRAPSATASSSPSPGP